MVSVVVLDWTAAGGGVVPTGGLPGFGGAGGVWPDGSWVEGGTGAGAVCPGVVGGVPRLAGGGAVSVGDGGVATGGDGGVGSGGDVGACLG